MSSDDLKNSAHVWGGDSVRPNNTETEASRPAPQHQDTPPSYENAIEPPRQPQTRLNPLQDLALLAQIPFTRYQVPDSTLSDDRSSNTTTHQLFYSRPEALHHLISEQATLPPAPGLHVSGTHQDANMSTKTDFDFTLNLTTLLDLSSGDSALSASRLRIKPPPTDRASTGSRLFKRSSSHQTPPTHLQLWTQSFCSDKSENKSFTLTRSLLDFPSVSIEGLVRTLLAKLNYRGKVTIEFPVQNSWLIVHKQPQNWFYNMLRLYPEKKYEAVEVLWDVRADGGGDERRVAEEWWKEWEGVVRNAVLSGKKGKCGVEEWMEWKMGVRVKDKGKEWGDRVSDW